MDTSNEIAIVMDEGGKLDRKYYKTAILDTIARTIEEYGYDPKHITANHLNACLTACRHAFFDTEHTYISNPNSNPLIYSTDAMEKLFTIYMEVAEIYACIPSLYGMERLTGVDDTVISQYLTPASLTVLKSRKEYIQNKLADSTLGVTVLANNDSSVGLMYTAQNQIRQETIKQGLAVDNLPKLSNSGSVTG